MANRTREDWERIHGDLLPLSKEGRNAYVANHGISQSAYDQARLRYGFSKKRAPAAKAPRAFKQFVAAGSEPMVVKLPSGCEIRIPSGDVASLRAVVEICRGGNDK